MLGRLDHDGPVAVDALVMEDGLDRPPAAQMIGPLAREQAVAQQASGRLQRPPLYEHRVVVDQHPADQLGVAHEVEAVPGRKADEDDSAVLLGEAVHRRERVAQVADEVAPGRPPGPGGTPATASRSIIRGV